MPPPYASPGTHSPSIASTPEMARALPPQYHPCSLSSASSRYALSTFYLQLCIALDLSVSNTCALNSIARVLLLSVWTISAFTPKIPVCSFFSASLYITSISSSSSFIVLSCSNVFISDLLIAASFLRRSLSIGPNTKVFSLPRDLQCGRGLLFTLVFSSPPLHLQGFQGY